MTSSLGEQETADILSHRSFDGSICATARDSNAERRSYMRMDSALSEPAIWGGDLCSITRMGSNLSDSIGWVSPHRGASNELRSILWGQLCKSESLALKSEELSVEAPRNEASLLSMSAPNMEGLAFHASRRNETEMATTNLSHLWDNFWWCYSCAEIRQDELSCYVHLPHVLRVCGTCHCLRRLLMYVAGATFIATGGSMPDLCTSFIATFQDSEVSSVTIAGSAVFNVLFVIAVCALFAAEPLSLTWWPLLRDCMPATMGYLIHEITGKFPGYFANSLELKFEDITD